MKLLKEHIGETLVARIVCIDEQQPALVKLLAVDEGGIWIESQKATEHLLAFAKQSAAPKTPAYFVPYSGISWLMSSTDSPALSEKSFGL